VRERIRTNIAPKKIKHDIKKKIDRAIVGCQFLQRAGAKEGEDGRIGTPSSDQRPMIIPVALSRLRMIKETNPSRLALCIMLAKGNHVAGTFLHSVVYWSKYGRAEIPNVDGYWIANNRNWWRREVCLGLRQYDRAVAKLATWGLIEKRQWWFGGRNILFIRPTSLTQDFLASAKTWAAAKELVLEIIANTSDHMLSELSPSGKPGLPNSEVSKGNAKVGNSGMPASAISNNIKHYQNLFEIKEDTPTSAPSASPTCAIGAGLKTKEEVNAGKKSKINKYEQSMHSYPLPEKDAGIDQVFSLKQLCQIWTKALDAEYPETKPNILTSKPKGNLAEIYQRLGDVSVKNGSVDFRPQAGDIIVYAVQYWPQVMNNHWGKKSPYPDLRS
jgi:hypothetical protein